VGVAALFFVLGALAITAQTVLVRELLVLLHGTELMLGLALSAWLAWIAVGAGVGSVLARRARRPRLCLWSWLVAAGPALVLEVPLVRLAPGLAGIDPGLVPSFAQGLGLAVVAALPFALTVGATFPLGARLLAEASGRSIAGLYAAEAAGSVVGGLLFGLVLVGRVAPMPVLAVGAAVVVAAASRLVAAEAKAAVVAGAAVAASLVLASPWLAVIDEASLRDQVARLAPGQEVLRVVDTPYQRLALTRLSGQYTIYADGLPGAAFPDAYETSAVCVRLLVQRPGAARILILGEAASGLAQALQAGSEPRAVTFVSPDVGYTALVEGHLPGPEREGLGRVRQVVDDPRAFVRTTSESFDLVFIAAPPPTSVAGNRLFTAEAFASLRRVLRPGGVVALHESWASERASPEQRELSRSVRAALASAFHFTLMTAADDALLFASDEPDALAADPATMRARLAALPGGAAQAAAMALEYDPGRRREVEAALAEAIARPNTDERPSSQTYGTVLWGQYGGGAGARWLGRLVAATAGAGPGLVLAVVVAVVAGVVPTRRRRPGRRAVTDAAVTVSIMGAASMATSVALLLSFQSACGSLYGRLAVVSALFMAGLALGAIAIGRLARHVESGWVVVAVLAGFAALAAALSAVLPALGALAPFGREVAHGLAFLAAGLGLGGVFPAVGQVLVAGDGEGPRDRVAARVAAHLDAFDHLGASVGALVTGTVALPALGTTTSLRLVAAVTAGAAIVWIVRLRRER
jgi:spermidine synthase